MPRPAEDPPLILACGECGVVDDHGTALLAQAKADIKNLEIELRAKRSQISKLRNEQYEKLRKSKFFEDAMRVLTYWQRELQPTARELDSEERLGKTIARLNGGRSVEELMWCIDGYAKFPYVVPNGGRSEVGSPSQWYGGIETIFLNDSRVEQGLRLRLREQGIRRLAPERPEFLDWHQVRKQNYLFILQTLQGIPPLDAWEDPLEGVWHFNCPKCWQRFKAGLEMDFGTMTLHPVTDFTIRLVKCSKCNVDDATLLTALAKRVTR